MSHADRLERDLAEWFVDTAAPQGSDVLDDILWQTAHTSQRPAWTFLERWIPVEITMSRVQAPRGARYVFFLVILILATAIAVAIVGSQRKVPAPYGLAANGVVAFTTAKGDIAAGDPVSGVVTTIVGGPELDSSPAFSLDGTRIAFVRKVEDMVRVFVVAATGDTPVEVTDAPLPAVAWLRWAPDGKRLAWLSGGSLWIAMADGSEAHALDINMIVREDIAWRPPDGSEILVHGLPEGSTAYGLFLVRSDGSDVRPVTAVNGGSREHHYLTWSPDGTRFAYGSWENAAPVHVITVDGLRDVVIKPDDGSALLAPAWSPDGTRIAFTVERKGIGVASANDDTPQITLTGPSFSAPVDFDWSPDGNFIFAVPQGTGEPWLMDPAGGPGQRVSWALSDFPGNGGLWSNWQRLSP